MSVYVRVYKCTLKGASVSGTSENAPTAENDSIRVCSPDSMTISIETPHTFSNGNYRSDMQSGVVGGDRK